MAAEVGLLLLSLVVAEIRNITIKKISKRDGENVSK